MKKGLLIAFTMTALSAAATAADAPRAGMCGSMNAFSAGSNAFYDCEHIGRVKSVNEIYQKGFRVVSSGFVPKDDGKGMSTYFYLLIEERK